MSTTVSIAWAFLALPLSADDESYEIAYLDSSAGRGLEVGGMDFLPDGSLALSTRRGQVWIVEDPMAADPADAGFRLFCEGLWEGLRAGAGRHVGVAR